MSEVITSLHNPLVKELKQLARSSKTRQDTNSLLLEGTHLLQEALAHRYPLSLVGTTEQWLTRHPDLYAIASQQVRRVIIFSESALAAIATSVNPDGVIALGTIHLQPPQINSIALALWHIQDPGNMGTLLRSAVAVGIEGILLSDNCVDITNPKILRASAGQWFRAPMEICPNLNDRLYHFQQQGFQIVATSAQAQLSYWEWNFTQPTILLLGNEGNGLPDSLSAISTTIVKIPTSPAVESLNVAIAGSLILYEIMRQRLSKPQGDLLMG
jgi:TrmH family RNA methyltransferase